MEAILASILTFIGTSILWSLSMWWSLKKIRAEANKAVMELEELKKTVLKGQVENLMLQIIREVEESKATLQTIIYVNPDYFKSHIKFDKQDKPDQYIILECYEELKRKGKIKEDNYFGHGDYI